MDMENNELPAEWTDKQRAAYAALKASTERYERELLNRPGLMNKAPKGGWTDTDKVQK